ncbi:MULTISPECIES: hypothetical protein [unclassified Nostoc]|uniref:hypothetical protein n=1 Tax=unclassified Nostoc TaxID=2593658 RepID=UPI00260C27F8|nr:hypothetical protein [Nostoc sp. S13]MDF5737617.1 hypothetical protein [Nostoc sp. S13]
MGSGEWGDEGDKPCPNAQCPMPNAQCPMPNPQCPIPNPQCPMPNSQSPITYNLIRRKLCHQK